MSSSSGFVRNTILFGAIGLVSIGLLEAGAWAFLYFNNGRHVDRSELQKTLTVTAPADTSAKKAKKNNRRPDDAYMHNHVLHPYMGYVMNYQVPEQPFNGLPIDVRVNDYGLLGDIPPAGPGENSVSIGLFGGSVAAEVYIYGREAFIQELKKYPAFANKRIRLSSIALGGMKQPQQLMGLNYLLSMGKHFDIVVNLDGFNEVALPFSENVRYHVAPYFPARWQFFAEEKESAQTASIKSEIIEKRKQLAKWSNRISRTPLRDSYFALAAWQVFYNRNNSAQRALEEEIRDRYTDEGNLSAQQAGPPYYKNRFGKIMPDLVELWQRTSLQIWQICQARDIAYYHFLQPNQYVADSKELSDWERQNAYSPPNYWYRQGAEKGYPLLFTAGETLREAGVNFSDATKVFREDKETIYKDTCCHYNQRGNKLLAAHMARVIADNWPPIEAGTSGVQ